MNCYLAENLKLCSQVRNLFLKSNHPQNEIHQEANQHRQIKQAEFYNRKTGNDQRTLKNKESVYVRDSITRTWKPAIVLNRPQPMQRPRTYLVDIDGKVYQRTREHFKPRGEKVPLPPQSESYLIPKPSIASDSTPSLVGMQHLLPSTGLPTDHNVVTDTTLPTPDTENHSRLPSGSPPHHNPESSNIVKEKKLSTYQPKVQTTRAGRVTRIPDKFRD